MNVSGNCILNIKYAMMNNNAIFRLRYNFNTNSNNYLLL